MRIADAVPVALVYVDTGGRVRYVNTCLARWLNCNPTRLLGRRLAAILGLRLYRAQRSQLQMALAGSRSNGEYATVLPQRGHCHLALTYIPDRVADGHIAGCSLLLQDITQSKHTEEALRASEERYALAMKGPNEGLWDWSPLTKSLYLSARLLAILGFENDELHTTSHDWLRRVHPDDRMLYQQVLSRHLKGETDYFECEYRVCDPQGQYRWVLARGLALRNSAGTAYRMVGSIGDITERKRIEEQLRHDAFHDRLTGLPNRALFEDRLHKALENHADAVAVLYLDFDRFKLINDSLGHSVGDRMLQLISQRLRRCVRERDMVARLGGDEFAVLLTDLSDSIDVQQALEVAGRIAAAFAEPLELVGERIFTSASTGIARGIRGMSAGDLLKNADIAMYRAKALGRGRWAVFEPGMHQQASRQLRLETDLRQALERQELFPVFQPIMALGRNQPVGFELLLRWQHPGYGLIGPADFIPLAEDIGLIDRLGLFALRQACLFLRRSTAAQIPPYVSVNLSPRQLTDRALLAAVRTVLHDVGVGPARLKLELTENAIMDNPSATLQLERLRAEGFSVLIDDFGTGYSSLGHLHRFPVDGLKIDRSFVAHMREQGDDSELVALILALGRGLKVQVIAEGVETAYHARRLQQLGCVFGQGYYFARPLLREGALAFLRERPVAG